MLSKGFQIKDYRGENNCQKLKLVINRFQNCHFFKFQNQLCNFLGIFLLF